TLAEGTQTAGPDTASPRAARQRRVRYAHRRDLAGLGRPARRARPRARLLAGAAKHARRRGTRPAVRSDDPRGADRDDGIARRRGVADRRQAHPDVRPGARARAPHDPGGPVTSLDALNEDFRDLLRTLVAEEAEFVVVGAYALAFHGLPRATGDIDVLVR